MTPVEPVALVGMMGVGKSTIGRLLAQEWQCGFDDTDEAVQRLTGRTVAEVFADEGEEAFRALEREALERLLGADDMRVLSCGGGIVTNAANRDLLTDRATVVWLTASLDVLARRVGDGRTRPLLGEDPRGTLDELMAERARVYGEIADHVVDTTDCRPWVVAQRVAEVIG